MDGDQVMAPHLPLPCSWTSEASIAIFQASIECKSLFPYSKYEWWLTFTGMFEVKFSLYYVDFIGIFLPSVSYLPLQMNKNHIILHLIYMEY